MQNSDLTIINMLARSLSALDRVQQNRTNRSTFNAHAVHAQHKTEGNHVKQLCNHEFGDLCMATATLHGEVRTGNIVACHHLQRQRGSLRCPCKWISHLQVAFIWCLMRHPPHKAVAEDWKMSFSVHVPTSGVFLLAVPVPPLFYLLFVVFRNEEVLSFWHYVALIWKHRKL